MDDLEHYMTACSRMRGENETLREALMDANEQCRSAFAIAEREGNATNWDAFRARLQESLDRQHAIMHPSESA